MSARSRRAPRLEFVITYLEMTERPSRPPVPHPAAKLALLRAEDPPVSFYRFLYNTVGEPWLWWERRALDDRTLASIIEDPDVHIYVLYVGGVPAGFAELDMRRRPAIDLSYFGLLPEFIGHGLGQYLLNAVIDIAWSHEPERLTVNTCNYDHPRALRSYQRAGFRPYDQTRRLVEDPRARGYIPRDIVHRND